MSLTDIETPLQDALECVDVNAPDELIAALTPIARGNSPETLETSGYVIHSLQTALHDGLTATSVEEAIVTRSIGVVILTLSERLQRRSLVRDWGRQNF